MSIGHAVALAIHSDLDIIEAFPDVMTMPVERLEPEIDAYIHRLHRKLKDHLVRNAQCSAMLQRRDRDRLCYALSSLGVTLPPLMLYRLCGRIIELVHTECRYLGDTRSGHSLYRMSIQLQR